MLNDLHLMIQKGFKLLNSFSLHLQDMDMFSIGQCYEVGNPIVVLDTIEVMNNPPFGQLSPIIFFPYYNMLKNKPQLVSPMVFRSFNVDVSRRCLESMLCIKNSWISFATYFGGAAMAPFSISSNQLSTIFARMESFGPKSITDHFRSTPPFWRLFPSTTIRKARHTPNPTSPYHFPTINAGVRVFLFVITMGFMFFHNLIIPHTAIPFDTYKKRNDTETEEILKAKILDISIEKAQDKE